MKRMVGLLLLLAMLLTSGMAVAEATVDTGIWEKCAFVDDFGDPTDQYYYTAKMSGYFSNSVTTNSEATATIIIDPSNEDSSVSLIIYEYGSQQVKNPYSSNQKYEVKIKDAHGTIHTFDGYMYSDRITIYDASNFSWSPMQDILARGGKIQFSIQPVDDKVTKYNFTINNADGFSNLFPITSVGSFSEGLASFTRGNRYSGYLKQDGTESLPCKYVKAGSFNNGLAYIGLSDRTDGYEYGYIDKDGNVVLRIETFGVTSFSDEGIAYVYEGRYIKKAIDTSGTLISELSCEYFEEGLAPVYEDKLWGYMDLEGNVVIPCQYTSVTYFNDGIAMVKKEDEDWTCIDTKGNVLFSFDCESSNGYSEGLASIWVGEKDNYRAGYIDKNGSLVIPAIYINALGFVDGRAPVSNGEKWGVIDKLGNTIADFNIAGIKGVYSEGMLAVQNEDGKWGFIDIDGAQTVSFEYDQVENFSDGLARVQKNNKWGFVTRDGVEIIPCEYDDAKYGEGYFTLLKDGVVAVKPRTELQPNYISEEEAYLQGLTDKLAEEEIAGEEARKAMLMLREYTDKETVKAVQTALNEAGYDCGKPDGIAGKGTAGAVTKYQTDMGLNITGTITHELLISLGVIAE